MNNLNSEHLRTFLAVAEVGSVTGGGERIGRSQSATSLQIKQLEETIGKPLFRRHGRGITLTIAGEELHPVARQVVHSLDSMLENLRGEGLKGKLRIGVPDDHSRAQLAEIVARFAARHPDVELEVHCAMGTSFADALQAGALDLAVYEVPDPFGNFEVLRNGRLIWMCSNIFDHEPDRALPIAVFDRDCWWRERALTALAEAGLPYRIVFSSESAVGVRAAVRAGIAVGLLNEAEQGDLRLLPDLANGAATHLILRRADTAKGPAVEAMGEAIRTAFAA